MWVLPDPSSELAHALRRRWVEEEITLIAPPLFRAEVTSVIREWLYRGDLLLEEAEAALESSLAWPITIREPDGDLQRRAFTIATEYDQPKAYDAQYLSLAALLGCEFWTGDQRLVKVVGHNLPWAKWIGDYTAP